MHLWRRVPATCLAMTAIAIAACSKTDPAPTIPLIDLSGGTVRPPAGRNLPPVIALVTVIPASILVNETALLRATVSDPNDDAFTCTWTLERGGTITPRETCTAELRATEAGTLRVSVVATDSAGAKSAASTVEVAVGRDSRPPAPTPTPEPPTPGEPGNPTPPVPTPAPTPVPTPTPGPTNRPPQVALIADSAGCSAPCSVRVRANASDPDGDAVTLTFGGCAAGTFTATTAEAQCQVPSVAAVTATVSASDGRGGNAQASVSVQGQPTTNQPPSVVIVVATDTCHPRPSTPCRIAFSARVTDPDPGDTFTYAWGGCTSGTAANAECIVSGLADFNGTVTVRDRAGATASASAQVRGINTAPGGSATAAAPGCHPYPAACRVDVSANGSDADGDPLTYTWTGCASGTSTMSQCLVPLLATTSQTATVSISDGWTAVSRSVTVQALNQAPTVSASGGGPCHPRPGSPCSVPVSASASDPDGDPLTLAWSGCAAGSSANATCLVDDLGNRTATVTATDPFGGQRSASVSASGVNRGAVASASPPLGGGAAAFYTLGWSDADADIVACQLAPPSDARCEWQPCSLGGSANGSRQCQLKVAPGTPQGSLVCDLLMACRDVWNQGTEVTFRHQY